MPSPGPPTDLASPSSEASNYAINAARRRRIPGACDICKRKKIKCDSGERKGRPCSNCEAAGYECTHKEVTKALGPAKGYVENLEMRLEKMQKLLNDLLPGMNLKGEMDRLTDPSTHVTDTTHQKAHSPPSASVEPQKLPRNDDDEDRLASGSDFNTFRIKRLQLNPTENRFFGKSSGFQLVQTALDLKSEYTGWSYLAGPTMTSKRSDFWDIPPWSTVDLECEQRVSNYVYPEDDLLSSLVDIYFDNIYHFVPLLHRPTFERSISEGLHFKDSLFGATVLLVCALGSKYSDDPRVFTEGSNTTRSAGYKWFKQVNISRRSFSMKASLYELQMHALTALYIQSTVGSQGAWTHIGVALRMAQDVGAHRRRPKLNGSTTADAELWKRAFWVLLSIDRILSSFSGRPCILHEEEYDQDLPIECDDEYWQHTDTSQRFQQPPGKPSTMSFFLCHLRLMDILARVMRYVYAIKRSKAVMEKAGFQSEQQIIASLDSEMNKWMDSVPDHLRWNPNCKNTVFLKQSAALHAMYYHVQIFIHRPFIPSPRNRSAITFPSLAICTNAARSCCHVLEVFSRLGTLPLADLQMSAFTSAVVLLLSIWSGKRSGIAPNPQRDMHGVQTCMDMLAACEQRWSPAGRYRDLVMELASVGRADVPLGAHKFPLSSVPPESPLGICPLSPNRPSRVNELAGQHHDSNMVDDTESDTTDVSVSGEQAATLMMPQVNYALPMYTNELGQLPIYGQFGFSDAAGLGFGLPTHNQMDPRTGVGYRGPPGNVGQSTVESNCNNVYNEGRQTSYLVGGDQALQHNVPPSAVGPSQSNAPVSTDMLRSRLAAERMVYGDVYQDQHMIQTADLMPNRTPWGTRSESRVQAQQSSVGMDTESGPQNEMPTADAMQMMDSDTMTMWLTAANNFECGIFSPLETRKLMHKFLKVGGVE
ncbi:hypothetical protein AX17_004250 [Amanita inopinata Kibby_2008]|nr:hypothetical protein AX17_004250 [Amanita inopinata Kibby_2008]